MEESIGMVKLLSVLDEGRRPYALAPPPKLCEQLFPRSWRPHSDNPEMYVDVYSSKVESAAE